MEYRNIKGLELPVSRLIFGTASDPMLAGENVNTLLDAVVNMGITSFDTAREYGESEKSLGNWIRERNNRNQITVITKCCHPMPDGTKRVNRQGILEDVERSLAKLQTDYIDLYLFHRDDPEMDVEELVETMNELVKKGKIRAYGGSNWEVDRIKEADIYAKSHAFIPFAASSPNFGLAEQITDMWGGGGVSISGKDRAGDRVWYEESQMPVLSYSSLGRGFFSGKLQSGDIHRAEQILDSFAMKGYVCERNFERLKRAELLAGIKGCTVAQLSLAWVLHQKMNTFAIVSSTNPDRMRSNLTALRIEINEKESQWLDLQRDEFV
ncbi:MAG: aldo/keto reductase [Lachnospiraceae bacterium]|nr:aldo/keto reductase [Lachnospiraceae bacterium]